ncbi:hypothetical protein GCM10010253_65350 [Streptomyces badius]|uniref:Uncharacterized protein n=1 Tax=Streptomyces badius TaxID=1941 RepID=A0ABQ2TNZ9_STRBA|nr:hypothetical protein GCM10010253_65350 [Streptomyces badius]
MLVGVVRVMMCVLPESAVIRVRRGAVSLPEGAGEESQVAAPVWRDVPLIGFLCRSVSCGVFCMTVDIRVIRAGQMYRYYLRETVVGDGRRPARTPLRAAQEQAGVPVGRWMGRGLAVLGLVPREEVTESQLRNRSASGAATRTGTGSRPTGLPRASRRRRRS